MSFSSSFKGIYQKQSFLEMWELGYVCLLYCEQNRVASNCCFTEIVGVWHLATVWSWVSSGGMITWCRRWMYTGIYSCFHFKFSHVLPKWRRKGCVYTFICGQSVDMVPIECPIPLKKIIIFFSSHISSILFLYLFYSHQHAYKIRMQPCYKWACTSVLAEGN